MLKQEIPVEHGKVSGNFDMKLKQKTQNVKVTAMSRAAIDMWCGC